MKTVVLTGGAGYIGKCTAILLREAGYSPILVDNFSTSRHFSAPKFDVHEVELTDPEATARFWKSLAAPHALIHFAARALVPESCQDPGLYFHNNLLSALNLAKEATRTGTLFVHSSSCAVYGLPKTVPITESTEQHPISPYGESKALVERMLHHFRKWKGLRVLNLRYFNPAGAIEADGGWVGEGHDPETHLIPNVVAAARAGQPVKVFGTDYPTPDGSCVRDFIHIADLAEAHRAAIQYLESTPAESTMEAMNVGAGRGTSVLQVIREAERVLQRPVKPDLQPRRQGDPPTLVADISLARRMLKWEPKRTLADMLKSHFSWAESGLEL